MILLAAVHLTPLAGVPLAIVALAALAWYHARLAGEGVPTPRRRVRRMATVAMAAGVLALVVAVSFADPAVRPTLYVASWTAVVALLLFIVCAAVADIAVSSWLIGLEHDEEAMRRGAAVLAALEQEAARRAADGDDGADGGDSAGGDGAGSARPSDRDASR